MTDLRTKFLGVEIDNPIIAGASSLTSNVDSIKRMEKAGVGAVVITTLFEEDVQHRRDRIESDLEETQDIHAEMTGNVFPQINFDGSENHLMWTKKTLEAVDIPVFASLNAVSNWKEYALKLAEVGVAGIEVNFYASPDDFEKTAAQVEEEQLQAFKDLRAEVKIPLGVKLSHFYSAPLNFIKRLFDAGADGVVLFNRFLEPGIDIKKEQLTHGFHFSSGAEYKEPLRFTGLLYGNVKGDISITSGIENGSQIAQSLLAGAHSVQVASALYRNSVDHISQLKQELTTWMKQKGYDSLEPVIGKLSKSKVPDQYRSAQYIK
jgi:dihydroorotate dehydrogenase (fumarate)